MGVRLALREQQHQRVAVRTHALSAPAHTAAETADALGRPIEQVAKSLVYVGARSGRVYVAVLPGHTRADEARLAQAAGEKLRRPNAETVLARTGFAVGEVPPVGHADDVRVIVDRRLDQVPAIYAGAGRRQTLIELSFDELVRAADADVATLS
jgi:prolyl-tRNA editing enzyme YbaK/EbsC (Cys-tRNA(Pro) deacylase)